MPLFVLPESQFKVSIDSDGVLGVELSAGMFVGHKSGAGAFWVCARFAMLRGRGSIGTTRHVVEMMESVWRGCSAVGWWPRAVAKFGKASRLHRHSPLPRSIASSPVACPGPRPAGRALPA